jgi:hypothetical protein
MSQEITLLITKDDVHPKNIPSDQIFFHENGYNIFPLNINGNEFELIANTLKKFKTFKEIMDNYFVFSTNVNIIIFLVKSIKSKSFLLEHYAEHGDVPYNWNILMVKNGELYTHNDYDSIEDVLGYFKFNGKNDDINIDNYKSYEICEYKFKNNKL